MGRRRPFKKGDTVWFLETRGDMTHLLHEGTVLTAWYKGSNMRHRVESSGRLYVGRDTWMLYDFCLFATEAEAQTHC